MNYLRNTWYVAAWNTEINSGALFTRTLLNEPILFFRDETGQIQAIYDRCPHRFVPLSKGKLSGSEVQCAYHGLKFDGTGGCTHNPHGDGKIPRAAVVKRYPVVEKYSMIWIWMGDIAKADEALIPDFSCQDPSRYAVAKGYLYAQANYVLESDNILDLSHIEFLHPGSLGSESVSKAATSVEEEGNTIWSFRQTSAEILPDFVYTALGVKHGTVVDRWIDVRWNAPANMLIFVGATPTGQPRAEGRESYFPQFFTPETDSTTHYWYSTQAPLEMGEEGQVFAQAQLDGLTEPFSKEDLPMLEAQQVNMGEADFWSLKPVLLPGDAAAVRARRALDKLILEESAANIPAVNV